MFKLSVYCVHDLLTANTKVFYIVPAPLLQTQGIRVYPEFEEV